MRVSGECDGNAVVMPGVWIGLADCGTKLSGLYYVTEAEHVFGAGVPYITRFRSSGRRAAGLSMNRSASGPPVFGQVGFVIGVVTNVKDDDKKMHRVKVRFPTLPDVESTWARVVTLGGEAAAGMEARPEVDDEVLVGFEQGDPRRPFVIGALLSKTDAYRTGTVNSDGSINKRGIRTRAGNKLEMFDGDSKSASSGRYIAIVAADTETELRLGDENMSLKTKGGNPITIESGQAKITLDNGKITITGSSIELKASQAFKVQGMTVDLKSDTAMGLDAGSTFKAQGQASADVSSSGMTQIKGSLLKLN
ncbi:MAG: phage baseplate assembly protein V [Ilumatobacteraceae bacterium]